MQFCINASFALLSDLVSPSICDSIDRVTSALSIPNAPESSRERGTTSKTGKFQLRPEPLAH
jgi:hypothetical protein